MDETNDLGREVDDAMRLFERAHVGSVAPLSPIRPARILLVLDGTGQDATSIDSAVHLHQRHNVETLVLQARETASIPEESGPTPDAAGPTILSRISNSREIQRPEGDAFDAILSVLSSHRVDLVIVPCPFGRDFEKVGADSAGTVIDVLLSRSKVPMLITRRADQPLNECVKRVSVMVSSECDVEARAAAWAFGLADPSAEISLNVVLEKEQFQNVRSIMEAMHPEETFDEAKLGDVLTQTHKSLHAAMHATASPTAMQYRLVPQGGKEAPPNLASHSTPQLIVLPLEVDDRFTQGFVQDRIRRSPHPILVVPGHVPG